MVIVALHRRVLRLPTAFSSAFVPRPPPSVVVYYDTDAPASTQVVISPNRKRSHNDHLDGAEVKHVNSDFKLRRRDDMPALASLRGKRSIEEVYFIDNLDTPESAAKHQKLSVGDDADTVDGAPAKLWFEWLYTTTSNDENTEWTPKLTEANLQSRNGTGTPANNQNNADDASDADSSSSFDGESILSCERYEAEALADPYNDNLDNEDAMSVDSDDDDASSPRREEIVILPGPRQLRSATARTPVFYSAAAAAAPPDFAPPSIWAQKAQLLKDGDATFVKSAAAFDIGANGFSRSATTTAPAPATAIEINELLRREDDDVIMKNDGDDDDDDLVATTSERQTASSLPKLIQHRASSTATPAFYSTNANTSAAPAFDGASYKQRQQQASLAKSGLVRFSTSSRAFGIVAPARPAPAVAPKRSSKLGVAPSGGFAPPPVAVPAAPGSIFAAPRGFGIGSAAMAVVGLRN
ncbi:hypothetical protein JCM9279_000047 [Rhodotorula babjevae]